MIVAGKILAIIVLDNLIIKKMDIMSMNEKNI